MKIQRLIIKNFGPIKHCDIVLNKMMVLDGPQAMGKSTIAKVIFFFRTVKDSLYELFFSARAWADPVVVQSAQYILSHKFYQMFGQYTELNSDMFLRFEYNSDVQIEISKKNSGLNNEIKTWDNHFIKFSDKIIHWLFEQTSNDLSITDLSITKNKLNYQQSLSELFTGSSEIVYIPAGRSMLSILSDALSYIFFKLSDREKNIIDYCTSDYIERVTRIRPQFKFSDSKYDCDRILSNNEIFNSEVLMLIREKMWHILRGRYKYIDGEELLELLTPADKKYIPIKFSSSGQQESLWILNFIYYYLLKDISTCFIIEEPEAHLYPNSQKDIAEYIALAMSGKNECIITTHSPYILGAFNNLLDAKRLYKKGYNISALLEKENLIKAQLINREDFSAYFVDQGKLLEAMDDKTGLIRNELIDEASDKINSFADDLFDLEQGGNF